MTNFLSVPFEEITLMVSWKHYSWYLKVLIRVQRKLKWNYPLAPLQINKILVSFLFLNTVCPWNETRAQSNLVRKQTLNNLVKITSLRPVWLYGWVFLYELSGCEFQSHWSHLSYWNIVPVLSKEVSGNFSDLRVKMKFGPTLEWEAYLASFATKKKSSFL